MANYTTGTITLTNGSAVVTGTGTAWQTALIVAGVVYPDAAGNPMPIASVDSNTKITAATKWRGATGTYAYAIARKDDENQIIRNAEALSELIEEMRNGTLFKYDVSGTLANRNSYGGQPQGFSYLANDGAALALYVKRSATLNDWAGPFSYGTGPAGDLGPAGPYTEITIGTVTTRPAGSGATVTQTVVDADTVALNFGIPAGQNGTGNGSVTSVGLSAPVGLSVGGSPVTVSGTLALSWAAGYQAYTSVEAYKLSNTTIAGYISAAFNLSNNVADPANDINFPAGSVASSNAAFPILMVHPAGVSQLDVAFGTGNGGRFDAAISDGTWHCFVISNGTTITRGFSKSLNPTTQPNYPAGYTHYRRVASWIRTAGSWIQMVQDENDFLFAASILERSSQVQQSDTLLTITAPLGIAVRPKLDAYISMNATGNIQNSFATPGNPLIVFVVGSLAGDRVQLFLNGHFSTNLQSQIRFSLMIYSGSLTNSTLTNYGWVDDRGRT